MSPDPVDRRGAERESTGYLKLSLLVSRDGASLLRDCGQILILAEDERNVAQVWSGSREQRQRLANIDARSLSDKKRVRLPIRKTTGLIPVTQ
jgi:hypothetical protein